MLSSNIDVERLETLIEINTLINSDYSDLRILLTRILESATKLSNGEASSLLLVNPENNKLYFEISLGSKGPEVQKFSLNMGEGIAGWVAQNNTSLIVNDAAHDDRHYPAISASIGFPTDNILAVPMRIKNECVGVIEILNKKNGENFNDADLQWLEIFATQAAIAIQNARSYQKVQEQVYLLQDEVKTEKGFHTFIMGSMVIQEKMEIVRKVARTNSSVLILGESGVGKELFAEQIHLSSSRAENPFIRVNCAALPGNLLESELFGHVKGAFTDASNDRRGRFELADGGTIFLDEIGDLPLELQSKLLRVIQHKIFEKLGSSEPILVDVRIIAATNKNMELAIKEGTFRKDLYYRLNVLPLYIPPLRERKEDIISLAEFFLTRSNREINKRIKGFTPLCIEAMMGYDWPGNVRELENTIERAVIICSDDYIQVENLILGSTGNENEHEYNGKKLKDALNMFKKQFIIQTLEQSDWKQTDAAKILGVQRTYLSRLLKELNIKR